VSFSAQEMTVENQWKMTLQKIPPIQFGVPSGNFQVPRILKHLPS